MLARPDHAEWTPLGNVYPGYLGVAGMRAMPWDREHTLIRTGLGFMKLDLRTGESSSLLDALEQFGRSGDTDGMYNESQCTPSPDTSRWAITTIDYATSGETTLWVTDQNGTVLYKIDDAAILPTSEYYRIVEMAWLDNDRLLYAKDAEHLTPGFKGPDEKNIGYSILNVATGEEEAFPYPLKNLTVLRRSGGEALVAGYENRDGKIVYYCLRDGERIDLFSEAMPTEVSYRPRAIMLPNDHTAVLSGEGGMFAIDLLSGEKTDYGSGLAFGTDAAGRVYYMTNPVFDRYDW